MEYNMFTFKSVVGYKAHIYYICILYNIHIFFFKKYSYFRYKIIFVQILFLSDTQYIWKDVF